MLEGKLDRVGRLLIFRGCKGGCLVYQFCPFGKGYVCADSCAMFDDYTEKPLLVLTCCNTKVHIVYDDRTYGNWFYRMLIKSRSKNQNKGV